jgi:hypothetical protein
MSPAVRSRKPIQLISLQVEAHTPSAWNWLVFARPQRRWAEVRGKSAFGRNLEMARKPTVDPDTSVDEIMRRWPIVAGQLIVRMRRFGLGLAFNCENKDGRILKLTAFEKRLSISELGL